MCGCEVECPIDERGVSGDVLEDPDTTAQDGEFLGAVCNGGFPSRRVSHSLCWVFCLDCSLMLL